MQASRIIDDTAKKLGLKNPHQVFLLAAVSLGYAEVTASIWFSRFTETKWISEEVANWCLDKLVPKGKRGAA